MQNKKDTEFEDAEKQVSLDEDSKIKSTPWQGWSTVVFGTLLMFTVGTVYITGNIVPYIASYYDVPKEDAANLLQAFFVCNSCAMPLGAFLA